jgi:hypothetical protein
VYIFAGSLLMPGVRSVSGEQCMRLVGRLSQLLREVRRTSEAQMSLSSDDEECVDIAAYGRVVAR